MTALFKRFHHCIIKTIYTINLVLQINVELLSSVQYPRMDKVLGWGTNEWVANSLGPEQTSALQIKTRSAQPFNVYL